MIKKELTVFVVVGVITVLIDFIVYNVLVEFRLSDVNVAKGVGFVSGTIFPILCIEYGLLAIRRINPGQSGVMCCYI